MGIHDSTHTLRLNISGMHCGNCVARVAKAITSVQGAEIQDIAIGSATVSLPPGDGGTAVEEIVAAVARAGYRAEAGG